MKWMWPAVSVVVLGYGVAMYGEDDWAYPAPMASWNEAVKESQRDAARKLVADLKEAVAKGSEHFIIPPGDYRFGSKEPKNIEMQSVSNMEIKGDGVTLWFEGRLRIDAIRLRECRNVVIKGLTVDYDPLPFSQGEITRIDRNEKFVDIKIDPGFPILDETWTKTPGSIKAIFYDPQGRQREVRMDWVSSLEKIGAEAFRVRFKGGYIFTDGSRFEVGDRLMLPDRSMRHVVTCDESESVTFEDITIYACPQMALTEVGGRGGNVYRRCRIVRRPGTRRLLACNADVFHSIMVEKGPCIEQCEFSHAGDDFINIHGFFSLVLEQRSPGEVVVVSDFGRGFDVGSELRFYDFDSLEPIGVGKVSKLRVLEDATVLDAAKRMPAELTQAGKKTRDFHPTKVYVCLVELDRPVAVKKYDLAACEDKIGSGAVIRSNYLHDGFVRGVLVKAAHARIERNLIERTGSAGIAVVGERYWLEGPFAHDVLIKGNVLIETGTMLNSRMPHPPLFGAISVVSVGSSDLSPGMQCRNIRIADNRIIRSPLCGILVANTRDAQITGNYIEGACCKQPIRPEALKGAMDPRWAICLASVEDVVVKGNTIAAPGPYCAGRIGLGKWVSRETVSMDQE